MLAWRRYAQGRHMTRELAHDGCAGRRLGLRRARLLGLCMLAGAGLLATGCATVQPWERETLSRPCMKTTPDPGAQGFEVHVHEHREGSLGGNGVSGGGCGCN